MIGAQLLGSVTKACWGCLIPLQISVDLRHIGIPIDFSFPLPFLPCIPFFVTAVNDPTNISELIAYNPSFLSIITSVLLFYAYCLMANGMVEYMSIVTAQLTNVTPARQEGKLQSKGNATAGVMSDIKSITTDPISSAASTIKSKTIDQNYGARPSGKQDQPKDFSGEISKGSRFDVDDKPAADTSNKNKGGNNA
jgi:type IV secretion system protein VirB6